MRFTIGETAFLLEGRPYVLRSGELHYPRIPRPYWRHRLKMLRALGCNTVATYDFWNLHEPQPGRWNFAGQADIAAFVRAAADEGLQVILRPGPYVCAEWDLGGLPAWLLKTPDMRLRTRDPHYIDAVRRYIDRFAREVRPLLSTNGGPVLLLQVENEYGSYGNDREYIAAVRDLWKAAGIDIPLFTCDGPSQLWSGSRTDLFCGVNGGYGALAELRRFRPTGPLIVTEYYPGWLSHWREGFPKVGADGIARDLERFLTEGVSFNLYMAHGGTNFGLTAGANGPPLAPHTTTYDYDAPIDEAGRATPKFHTLRTAIGRHLPAGERLPDIPAPIPTIAIASVPFESRASLLDHLPRPHTAARPLSMEAVDQTQGAILYRTTLPAGPAATLRIGRFADRLQIFVDGERRAQFDRRQGAVTLSLPARERPERLDLFVEAFGRINYGGGLHDRKGLLAPVDLDETPLGPWEIFPLELSGAPPRGLRYTRDGVRGPAFHRAIFTLDTPGDTYLDLRGWRRGMVWINGQHLGRYWRVGPQQTLYCPGCWLRAGENELVVLEFDAPETPTIVGRTEPILTTLRPDADPLTPSAGGTGGTHRKAGQTLSLVSLAPAWEGSLPPGPDEHRIRLSPPATGRFLALEILSNHAGDAFASLAELALRGTDGQILRARVVYADSEESASESGDAANVLDGDPGTFWHTEWSQAGPPPPHHLVLDLGSETEIATLTLLPRQSSPNGRIKGLRIFVRRDPFPGL
jgi:beta-galactosidase